MRDMMDSKDAVKILSIIAMAMAIVPMIAPLIGGFLDELYGWRTNFWVYLIMGVSLLVLIWLDLGETNTQKSDTFHKQFSTYPKLFKSGFCSCRSWISRNNIKPYGFNGNYNFG